MLDLGQWAIVSGALAVGATVQGLLGFGMAVVALPVVLLVAPGLIPGAVLVASLPLVVLVGLADVRHADWGETWWVLVGRVLGAGAAIVVLGVASDRVLALLAGGSVLGAVALSLTAPSVERRPTTLVGAGTVSGLFGTAVAIGGPPVALLYQRAQGAELRATVGLILMTGSPVAILTLVLSGNLGGTELRAGLTLWPAVLLGFGAARLLRSVVDRNIRPWVLTVCAVGGVVAIVDALL